LYSIQSFHVDLFSNRELRKFRRKKKSEKISKQAKQPRTYIKKYNISVWVSIMTINPIESLRKLYIANFFSNLRVHHETHGFSKCLAIVDVVITINIQNIRCVWDDCRRPYLQILMFN
jgi:hypothetical protein